MTAAIGNQKALTFPNAIDSGTTAERFAVDGFPTYILIDKAGKVVNGYSSRMPDDETIRNLLSAEVRLDGRRSKPGSDDVSVTTGMSAGPVWLRQASGGIGMTLVRLVLPFRAKILKLETNRNK